MEEKLAQIKKLTAFMRKSGLLVVKTSEFELQLSPTHLQHKKESDTKEGLASSDPAAAEQALYWSSPGMFHVEQ